MVAILWTVALADLLRSPLLLCWEWLLGGWGNRCQAAPKTHPWAASAPISTCEMSAADSAGAHCVGARRHRQLSVNTPDAGVREEAMLGSAYIAVNRFVLLSIYPDCPFVFTAALQSQGVEISKPSPFPPVCKLLWVFCLGIL